MRFSNMTIRDWYFEARYLVRRAWSFFVRGYYGVAPMDTWGFDHYLASIMARGFRELAKNAHGCPYFIVEEYGLDADEHGGPVDIDKAVQCWQDWLLHKAEWLEWYVADDLPLTEGMTQEEKVAVLNAYDKKQATFHKFVLPNIARNFGSLWD